MVITPDPPVSGVIDAATGDVYIDTAMLAALAALPLTVGVADAAMALTIAEGLVAQGYTATATDSFVYLPTPSPAARAALHALWRECQR